MPYALWLFGGLLATFPASILSGLFGRRAAFALGASFGLAGGLLAGWGFVAGQFPALLIGALWLGLAQGFGLFYRHAAATTGGTTAVAAVFSAGALAMFAAPATIFGLAKLGPLGPAALFVAAGVISLAAMASALTLPEAPNLRCDHTAARVPVSVFIAATATSAFAWFIMTALMGATPNMLAGCGYGVAAASGLIAWHMLAMYLPAAAIAPLAAKIGLGRLIALGLVLLCGAVALVWQGNLLPITAALTLAGIGWSLVTFSGMLKLHENGPASRLTIASFDALVFSGAILGALSAHVWLF